MLPISPTGQSAVQQLATSPPGVKQGPPLPKPLKKEASSVENILRAVRTKVSADKNRFREHHYDLDLTYITDRIIAMSFPADGVEKAYRNNIAEVAEMLQDRHKDQYIVYNLSERKYDYSKFNDQVQDWCGFPDHNAPPLGLLFTLCRQIHSWLSVDDGNIIVVHCLAGKGRTGVVISCYLMYCGLFKSADEALNFFALRRSLTNWGVTGPSQRRYVQYFQEVLEKKREVKPRPIQIQSITLETIPKFSLGPLKEPGCCPVFEIWMLSCPNDRRCVFSSASSDPNAETRSFSSKLKSLSFSMPNLTVWGDVFVVFKHVTIFYNTEVMFRLNFHTSFLPVGGAVSFSRADLDDAGDDKKFANEFAIRIQFLEPFSDSPQSIIPPRVISQEYTPALYAPPDIADGSVCFFPGDTADNSATTSNTNSSSMPSNASRMEKVIHARSLVDSKERSAQRSGYLFKKGVKVQQWRRRWFVLKDSQVFYYKTPRDLTPAGKILCEQMTAIMPVPDSDEKMPYIMRVEIITGRVYLLSAENKSDLIDWLNALLSARHTALLARQMSGTLKVSVVETDLQNIPLPLPNDVYGFYCEVSLLGQKCTTSLVKEFPLKWTEEMELPYNAEATSAEVTVTLFLKKFERLEPLADVKIPFSFLQFQPVVRKFFRLQPRKPNDANAFQLSAASSHRIHLCFTIQSNSALPLTSVTANPVADDHQTTASDAQSYLTSTQLDSQLEEIEVSLRNSRSASPQVDPLLHFPMPRLSLLLSAASSNSSSSAPSLSSPLTKTSTSSSSLPSDSSPLATNVSNATVSSSSSSSSSTYVRRSPYQPPLPALPLTKLRPPSGNPLAASNTTSASSSSSSLDPSKSPRSVVSDALRTSTSELTAKSHALVASILHEDEKKDTIGKKRNPFEEDSPLVLKSEDTTNVHESSSVSATNPLL